VLQGGVDVKVSYNKLYSNGYVPFTFAEFLGTNPVEEASATLTVSGTDFTVSELAAASVQANYAISDLTLTVTNPSGAVVGERFARVSACNAKTWKLLSLMNQAALNPLIDGKNQFKIDCRLGTGEVITIYTGILKK